MSTGGQDTTNCKGKRVCRRSEHEATSASDIFETTPTRVLPLSARHLKWLRQAVNGQLHWGPLGQTTSVTSKLSHGCNPPSCVLCLCISLSLWQRFGREHDAIQALSSVLCIYTVNVNKEGTYTQRSRTWLDNANPNGRQCSGPSVCM